jgi:predicted PurR-regulated permease PerM
MFDLDVKKLGGSFLLICLIAAILFAFYVFRPFIFIFITAGILALVSFPVYKRILNSKLIKGRKSLASLLTCLLIVLVIVIPVSFIIFQMTQQSLEIYQTINEKLADGRLMESYLDKTVSLQQKYFPVLDLKNKDLQNSVVDVAKNVSGFLAGEFASIMGNAVSAIAKFFLMFIAIYYFLIEGPVMLKWLGHLSPLPASYEKQIFQKFKDVSESAFYGSFLTAAVQGVLGGIGFAICGLPAFFWGVVMAFFSLIPMVGTAIIWVPAAIYLLFAASVKWHLAKGIFLLAWGVGVVGMSDNVLRPIFMKDRMALHPALIFFSILGGISAFGLLGIVLGPLAIALALVFINVFITETSDELDKLDNM